MVSLPANLRFKTRDSLCHGIRFFHSFFYLLVDSYLPFSCSCCLLIYRLLRKIRVYRILCRFSSLLNITVEKLSEFLTALGCPDGKLSASLLSMAFLIILIYALSPSSGWLKKSNGFRFHCCRRRASERFCFLCFTMNYVSLLNEYSYACCRDLVLSLFVFMVAATCAWC